MQRDHYTITGAHVRDGSNKKVQKWEDSGHVMKVELIEFAYKLNVECERKSGQRWLQTSWPEKLEECNCYLLRYIEVWKKVFSGDGVRWKSGFWF